MKNQYILPALFVSCSGLFVISTASAEGARDFGTGAHGVNRVIRTDGDISVNPHQPGFTGFQGNMDLSYEMPYDMRSTQSTGTYPPDINVFNNKPSMYVGGRFVNPAGNGDIEMDAGVQYEPGSFVGGGIIAERGWSIFFRCGSAGWISPKTFDSSINPTTHLPNYPNGKPWRGATDNSGNGQIGGNLTMQATTNGFGRLQFDALNVTYTNAAGNPVTENEIWGVLPTSPTRIPNANHRLAPWRDAANPPLTIFNSGADLQFSYVKRVTAVTRANSTNAELDGLRLVGTWSGCQVFDPLPAPGSWVPWTWQATRQGTTGPTGYDAPGTGPLSLNHRYNGQPTWLSRPIVSFVTGDTIAERLRNEKMRAPNTDETHEPDHSTRYGDETVVINLGTLARPIGGQIQ